MVGKTAFLKYNNEKILFLNDNNLIDWKTKNMYNSHILRRSAVGSAYGSGP